MSNWTLFSNHGHVLFCLSRDPEARLRDVASDVGITERAVQKIVRDLQDGGMISVTKSGRRNCYQIHKKQPLRHELESACTLRDLLGIVNQAPAVERPAASQNVKPAQARPARPEAKAQVSPVNPETEMKRTAAGAGSEPGDSTASAAPEADAKQAADRPEPVKPSSKKKAKREDSRSSDSLEKQQGSLF